MSLWAVLDEALEAGVNELMVATADLGVETVIVGNAWDGQRVDADGNEIELPLVMILSNQIEHADEDEYECDDTPALTRRYNYLISAFTADPDRRQARRDAQTLYVRLISVVKSLYPLEGQSHDGEYGHSIEWGRAYLEERGKATLAVSNEMTWLHAAHVAFDIVTNEGV